MAIGPAGKALKTALERTGVVPIGLSPNALRRVLSAKPLRTPEDFRGLRIRIYEAASADADLRALGADVVCGIDADRTRAALVHGDLDGVETGAFGAIAFGFWRGAKRMTAYSVFESFDTVVASRSGWSTLTERQQAVLRGAAGDLMGFSASVAERDDATIHDLCHAGVRIDLITGAQLMRSPRRRSRCAPP